MLRTTRSFFTVLAIALPLVAVVRAAHAQATPRTMRIEVQDRGGRPVADAIVSFFITNDSTRTDSSGVAKITVKADSVIELAIRKIGFEQRRARFKVGTATGFTVRAVLGDATQQLAEVEVREDAPIEPWRKAFEQRKKRGGGQFRDLSNFASRMPNTVDDWFAALPGVRTGGGAGNEINVPRCRHLGLWIDGQHATSPGVDYRFGLATIPAQDIAAFELYTSNTPAQYTGYTEDCSLVIWTRFR
jgi:hypothetical protein